MKTERSLREQLSQTNLSTSPTQAVATEAQTIRLLTRAGKVIAPVTVLGSLGYHFGREYAHARSSYFGVDVSLLGFSTQDYVLRSLDAVFVPVIAVATAGLIVVIVHSLIVWRSTTHSVGLLKTTGLTLTGLGAASVAVGLAGLAWAIPYLEKHGTFRDLLPAFGMVLLVWGVSLLSRWLSAKDPPRQVYGVIPSWCSSVILGLALTVMLVSLFAATTQWARIAGKERSESLGRRIHTLPQAAIYSQRLLSLGGGGISVKPMEDEGSAYRFRYTGLRFYIKSGGKLFLLPDEWSQNSPSGRMIVLEDKDSIRLELARGDGE